MSSTEIAPASVKTFSDLFAKSKEQIAMALPRHITPDKMIRTALTAMRANPGLFECSPMSVLGALMQAAQLGLELTGPLGHAYMVPFWNKQTQMKEAQFQIGYRGLIALAHRSGKIRTFCAHIVHQNDYFDYEYGTEAFLKHKPAKKDRGLVTDVYAVVITTDDGKDFEVMSVDDIEKHKEKFSQTWNKGFSPWKTAWDEMAKKTPLRRLAKRVPMSTELVQAATLDEYGEHGLSQHMGFEAIATIEHKRAETSRTDEIADRIGAPAAEANGHDDDQGDAYEGQPGEEDIHADEPPPATGGRKRSRVE